jgi:hypothetical protein
MLLTPRKILGTGSVPAPGYARCERTPVDGYAMGSDVEDFHRDFLPRFIEAQRAFHDGDPEPNNSLCPPLIRCRSSPLGDCG